MLIEGYGTPSIVSFQKVNYVVSFTFHQTFCSSRLYFTCLSDVYIQFDSSDLVLLWTSWDPPYAGSSIL